MFSIKLLKIVFVILVLSVIWLGFNFLIPETYNTKELNYWLMVFASWIIVCIGIILITKIIKK